MSQRLLKEIDAFVWNERDRSFLKLLFCKEERIATIEGYHRRLCSCANAFQVRSGSKFKDDVELISIRYLLYSISKIGRRETMIVDMQIARYSTIALPSLKLIRPNSEKY